MIFKRTVYLAAVLGLSGFIYSCGAKEALQCNGICDRYRDCFDSGYNTDACETRCQDKDDAGQVDDCYDCIDDKSCSSATFSCVSECAGLLP